MQVKSMKRKLQQETLIRKCKERRITYLSSKGKTTGMEGDTNNNGDEVTTLREEVTILREQLEAQPSESVVDWMIKYKEEKAKVEDIESKATTTFDADEKEKMEMKNDDTGLRQCERGCNEQFMSIKPVEESWIGNEMTLFSQS